MPYVILNQYKMNANERRKFLRFTAYHLAKYRLINAGNKEEFLVLISLKDVGAGGIRLRTPDNIPLFSLLELKINFPFLDYPVTAIAKVIWSKKLKKSGLYELGAEFTQIDEPARKAINEQINFAAEKSSQVQDKGK